VTRWRQRSRRVRSAAAFEAAPLGFWRNWAIGLGESLGRAVREEAQGQRSRRSEGKDFRAGRRGLIRDGNHDSPVQSRRVVARSSWGIAVPRGGRPVEIPDQNFGDPKKASTRCHGPAPVILDLGARPAE